MEEYIIVSKQPSIVIVESSKISMRLDAGNYRQDYLVNRDRIRNSIFGSKKLVELLGKPSFRGRGFPENPSGQDPVIKVRNVTNYGITGPYDYTDAIGISKSDRAWARKGDVLLTVTGLGSSGKADLFFFDTPMLIDGHVAILRCSSKCDAGFLKAFLSSSYGQKLSEQDTIGSTGQIELYGSYIDQFDIPYPDPKIQAYIGDKVRLAERCREEASVSKSRANENLNKLLQNNGQDHKIQNTGAFNKLLDTPYCVSIRPQLLTERLTAVSYNNNFLEFMALVDASEYEFVELGDYYDVSAMIGWKNLTTADYVSQGIKMLRVADISGCYVLLDNAVQVSSSKVDEQPQIHLQKGDIIFSKDGTLGIAAVMPEVNELVCAGSTLARLRKKTSRLDPYYLCAFLNSTYAAAQISYYISGIAQPHITQEYIKQLKVPLLPISQQINIGREFQRYDFLSRKAYELIADAKIDVENLIEGNLDIVTISSGGTPQLSWKGIEELLVNQTIHYA